MAKIYSITKWRKNSKGTGVIVQLTHYDDESETFTNVKANVQFASNYAGKNADEMPATTAKIDKDGRLWLCCTRFDDYNPDTVYKDKANAKADAEGKTKAKGKASRLQAMDDDGDIPF